jgi:hypothetical protein
VAPVTAALLAYDSTKSRAEAAGANDASLRAGKAALVAGGVTAAVGIGLSAALAMAAKSSPKMLGRFIPYVGEGLMAVGAAQGAKKHGAAGAVFGAIGADALLDLPPCAATRNDIPSTSPLKPKFVPLYVAVRS